MTSFDLDIDTQVVKERIRQLKEDYSSSPVYVVTSGAEYSVSIEFGRGPVEAQDADALRFENEAGDIIYRASVSGHPPYPFFRPAIRELEANPEAFLIKNTELDGFGDIDSTEELIESIALSLEAQMKKNATAQGTGRSPGTHPEHPKRQSGNLVNDIGYTRVR